MISREMNSIEIEVLNLIINKASFEKPITANDLRGETGLLKRQLEQVIESLRVNFGHPKNEEERQAGLAPYRRQILTEQKNLSIVMGVDLEKYWKLEHD